MDKSIQLKLDNFFKKYKRQSFKKGEILIRADENPSGVYYLTKGLVKEYAISKKGEEIVVNIFKPNSFFPMSWAINETANEYYFEALKEIETWKAPREDALELIKVNSDMTFDLLKRVYKGTDGLISRMVYLMSENAYDRVLIELIISSKRFGKSLPNGQIALDCTEKELAAQTGMTRETISREIKKLKVKSLVSFKDNILIIFDLKKLEKELLI